MRHPATPSEPADDPAAIFEDLPTEDEYEAYTMEQASAGNAEWGFEAFRICTAGLTGNCLSERMRFYLAQCLQDACDGVPLGRAMRVSDERSAGRPVDPQPDWETPLANFAALLHRRGYKAEAINAALDCARRALEGEHKALDRREAQRIRKKYAPMQDWSEEKLLANCERLGLAGEIQKYSPQT